MTIRAQLDEAVDHYLDKPFEIRLEDSVPDRSAISLENRVYQVEASALSIDVRQFTTMTNTLGRQVLVRMLKAFFDGCVNIIVNNQGAVADFNGDGFIALFTGIDRSENAFIAASEIRWFLTEVLRPRFDTHFSQERGAFSMSHKFDAGCGLDDGLVLVARVGASSFSDIAWVGRCVNTAAKLCKIAGSPRSTVATYEIYDRLDGSAIAAPAIWSAPEVMDIGGLSRTTVATDFTREPSDDKSSI